MLRVRDLTPRSNSFAYQLGSSRCGAAPTKRDATPNVFSPPRRIRTLVETSLAPADDAPLLELTYNWTPRTTAKARYFGHHRLRGGTTSMATCERLMKAGVTIIAPRDA